MERSRMIRVSRSRVGLPMVAWLVCVLALAGWAGDRTVFKAHGAESLLTVHRAGAHRAMTRPYFRTTKVLLTAATAVSPAQRVAERFSVARLPVAGGPAWLACPVARAGSVRPERACGRAPPGV